MSGRPARKKKLVRTKRLSDSDSSDHTGSVDGGGGSDATPTPSHALWPPLSRDSGTGMAEALNPKWRRAAVRAVELQAGSITAWPRHRTADLASTGDTDRHTSWLSDEPELCTAKLNGRFQESRKSSQVHPVSTHKSVFPAYSGNGKISDCISVLGEHDSVIPDVIPPVVPQVWGQESEVEDLLFGDPLVYVTF